MSLRFSTAGKPVADRELVALRLKLGGDLGLLSSGGREHPVLKLGENVYASTEEAPQLKTALLLEQSDLHVVKTNADAVYFTERYKAFEEAKSGEKAQ